MGFSISKKTSEIEEVRSGIYIVMYNGDPEGAGTALNNALNGDPSGVFYNNFTAASTNNGEVSTDNATQLELVGQAQSNETITHVAFYNDSGLSNLDWLVEFGGSGYSVQVDDRVFIEIGNLKFTL